MRQLTLTAVAVWLGAMGFFAFIAAPAAFGALDRDAAGRFVSAVFPRYYGVGLALGLVACFGLGVRWMGGAWRGLDWTVAGLVLLMLALTLYAGAVVVPAAPPAREAARAGHGGPARALGLAPPPRPARLLNLSGI